MNRLFNECCIDGMRKLSAESVDLVVTSPPYDNLRDYNESSQWNFGVFKRVAVALRRVLKPGGVIVWNVNDAMVDAARTGTSLKQCLYFQEIGLDIHDYMFYEHTGSRLLQRKKHYNYDIEFCFILSKGEPKTANLLVDVPNANYDGKKEFMMRKSTRRAPDGSVETYYRKQKLKPYRKRGQCWRYSAWQDDKRAYEHPAVMPAKLAADHIQTWSNPGDLVLDPFAGSGTTLRMAMQLGRNYVGFEIDKKYYQLAQALLDESQRKIA